MKLFKKITAFTLVELIIVVSIIAVLASLAFMALSGETSQARDAKRQADLTTFENAIATANSKNKKINYADLGVKQASITTNSGEIFPIRGAYLVEIKEGLFSTDIIATIPRDPKGAKYLGAFLSSNEYQLFATLENPATKIETALVKGTFKNGSILDILMEDLDDTDTTFKVANPTRFITGDKITIDDEEMTVVSFNTTTSELTVTRAGTKKVHNKQAVIKLKTAVNGGDSLVVYNKINTAWTAMTGVAATGVKADATDGTTIINESTNTPYIVSLSKSGNSASSSSSSSSNGAPVATCSDGIQNQDETGVDCGGACPNCPTCSDGIKNQNELGIDTGGVCGFISELINLTSYNHYANNTIGSPSNIKDGVLTTYSQSMSYIGINFGTGNEKNINKIKIAVHNSFARSNLIANSPYFQGSNDSSNGVDGTWNNLVQITSVNYGIPSSYPGFGNDISFTNSVNYKWYRIFGLPQNNNTVINEWELYGGSIGETCSDGIQNQNELDIDTGGVCGFQLINLTPYNHYANNTIGSPSNIKDGVLTTYSQSMSYIGINFGTGNEKNINKIKIAVHNSFARSNLIANSPYFQGSNDSSNGVDGTWNNLVQITSVNYGIPSSYPGFGNDISFTNSVNYKWYRIFGLPQNNNTVINEWELYKSD